MKACPCALFVCTTLLRVSRLFVVVFLPCDWLLSCLLCGGGGGGGGTTPLGAACLSYGVWVVGSSRPLQGNGKLN